MITLFLLAVAISADFEGGSIGEVKHLAEHHYQCALEGETDQDGRNRQATWYYFRVDGAAGREITIDLVSLAGEYNYKPNLTETAEYLDGPPEDRGVSHAALMKRLFGLLKDSTTFNPTRPAQPATASTTPGMRGRMTVTQGLYHDRQIPAFLIEQMIAFNSKLGRHPQIEDRLEFGAGLVKAMARAVE